MSLSASSVFTQTGGRVKKKSSPTADLTKTWFTLMRAVMKWHVWWGLLQTPPCSEDSLLCSCSLQTLVEWQRCILQWTAVHIWQTKYCYKFRSEKRFYIYAYISWPNPSGRTPHTYVVLVFKRSTFLACTNVNFACIHIIKCTLNFQ